MASRDAHSVVLGILDDLERRLDPAEQEQIRRRHIQSAMWEPVDRPPVIIVPPWDQASVKLYPVNEAVADPAKMLANELRRGHASAVEWLDIRDDRPPQVRPDFGIGLIASTLGARLEVVGDNPPWVHPVSNEDVEAHIEQILNSFDPENAHTLGWIPRAAETLEYYQETFRDYPKVSTSVAIVMPDLQGPFDTAGMLWGSEIFTALYTRPDLLDHLLATVADVMIHVHDRLRTMIGRELLPEGYSHQHGTIIRGNILIRSDSNVMMSPDMYANKVLPHDRRVWKAVGKGSFHSCGQWERNTLPIMAVDDVGSLDFGRNQSQLMDIDAIYRAAGRYHKHLNLVTATQEELSDGSILKRFPTGVTLACFVSTTTDAQRIMARYATFS